MPSLAKTTQVAIVIGLAACGSSPSSTPEFGPNPSPSGTQTASNSSMGSGAAPMMSPGGSGGSSSGGAKGSSSGTGSVPTGSSSGGSGGAKGSSSSGGAADASVADSGGSTSSGDASKGPAGPMMGDPNAPMVSVPNVACGAQNVSFGTTTPTVSIDGRDTAVLYPCVHEGAPVTFFLFLHGTLSDGQKIPFTMNAWPIHTLIDQYNIVEVVPQSAMGGTQWGNGDNGTDLPYLYDVVNWVYTTFAKLDIRSWWTQGGSWGAFYLSTTFACDAKFQGKLNGVQLIVGNGCPTCSDRMSCIVGQQEMQLGNGMALTDAQAEMESDMFNIAPYAMQHNCQAKTGPVDVGSGSTVVKWWDWPSCDKGWVYNYMMAPGQHADAWDPAAVLKVTQEMKAAEQ